MQIILNPSVEEVEGELMRVRAAGLVSNLELWNLAEDVINLAKVGRVTDVQLQTYITKLQSEPEY